jgi:hypothetical protein
MTTTNTTAIIEGRSYTINLDGKTVGTTTLYQILGARKAEGAVIVHTSGQYSGRALIVGISALQRLNWWDVSRQLAGVVPGIAA